MMKKIITLFLAFFTLSFAAYESELASFDDNFINANLNTQVKYHQQLKSLYIQSVINDDSASKVQILKRLIVSSNTLKIDDQIYIDELVESGVSKENVLNLKKATQIALEKGIQKPKANSPKEDIVLAKAEPKTEVKAQNKVEPKIQNKTEPKAQKNEKIYITEALKNDNKISLSLSSSLSENELKSFELNESGNYRYIVDFNAALDIGKQDFKIADKQIIISQYNPKTVRIVVRSKSKNNIKLNLSENSMSLELLNLQEKIEAKKTENKIESKKEVKAEAKTQEKKEATKEEKLYVLSVEKNEYGINLRLNKSIRMSDLNTFGVKDSKFRQVVSFKGVLEGGKKSFEFDKNNAISVVQFDPQTIRIVLSSNADFKAQKSIDENEMLVGFNRAFKQDVAQNTSKNQAQTKKTNQKAQATQNKGLNSSFKAGKLIVIDPGHGGKDSGAISAKKLNLKEKEIVLSTALKLGAELKKRGYKVLYTRASDKFINLRERTKFANDKNADLFLSIHANAAPSSDKAKSMQGFETFFLSPARSERSKRAAEKENQGDFDEINYFSKQSILNFLNREKIVASNKLAIDIQKNALGKTRTKHKIVDGGVREAPFWVLVGAQMPAVLLEIGYITHESEAKRIANKAYQELLAQGISDGVDSYFYNNR